MLTDAARWSARAHLEQGMQDRDGRRGIFEKELLWSRMSLPEDVCGSNPGCLIAFIQKGHACFGRHPISSHHLS